MEAENLQMGASLANTPQEFLHTLQFVEEFNLQKTNRSV
jgi:hypothetical protein